ncbi:MAG: hypothetical protein A4S12_03000 [Proteobacteria bacterium SG_bin5]|nr:transposase [Sphingomonas sp.]OQW45085.1 MAG: hypothetical protein A4S12_03000 [Proteobacteria bacterium SG_bin5]
MPLALDPGAGPPITLDELIDALADAHIDPRDVDALASLGPIFARLGRNADFLAERATAELLRRADEARPLYGPQVLLLHPPDGRFLLRACFWPAADDAVTRAAGAAAFFYGLPHDHNFSFLSYGYFGPGYDSDDYEYDGWSLRGEPGEAAGLIARGRRRLTPGALVLYRARRDVHCQLPPPALSVSLNLMAFDPAQPWIDQYRFDLATGTIAQGLTTAPAEALLALAVAFGTGADVAARLARGHPMPRLRLAAYAALAAADGDRAQDYWEAAADDPALAAWARTRLARLGA